MKTDAMLPYGHALTAFSNGKSDAELTVRRDDGYSASVPISVFFRTWDQFSGLEQEALDRCKGFVLDVGAGTGQHSLVLQGRGLRVRAIDVNADAVRLMRTRGVRDVRQVDIFQYDEEPCDTMLLLGHGIGMVEDLDGLLRFLREAHRWINPGGQILTDSMDVTVSEEPSHRSYHQEKRRRALYAGETRMRFEFEGEVGAECGWLHIDPTTLSALAEKAGWISTTLVRLPSGEHLALLRRQQEGS